MTTSYTTTLPENEFTVFCRLASSIMAQFQKNGDFMAEPEQAHVLALYILNRISRYGVTKYYMNQWYWDKTIDALTLTEIFTEADKYNVKYKE